ncbi:hypothetical protein FTX61_14660 [Nitriliruptoraceae bacterium ZYF776]|nr:hypothetical protein [Profundirhabdus halotolerans]
MEGSPAARCSCTSGDRAVPRGTLAAGYYHGRRFLVARSRAHGGSAGSHRRRRQYEKGQAFQ